MQAIDHFEKCIWLLLLCRLLYKAALIGKLLTRFHRKEHNLYATAVRPRNSLVCSTRGTIWLEPPALPALL